MIICFISLIVSLLFLVNAPTTYSWSFCFSCFVVYLIQTIIEIVREIRNKNLFSFNPFFLFAFFWVSYAYPLIIYGTELAWFGEFSEYVNWDYLSKASALCSVFISSYLLGYNIQRGRMKGLKVCNPQISKYKPGIRTLLLVTFGLFMLNSFVSMTSSGWHTDTVDRNPFLFDFYYASLVLSLFCFTEQKHAVINLKNFIRSNLLSLSLSIIPILFFLVIGDRGPAIRIFLILATVYYVYYKRVKFIRLLIIGVLGVGVLFFVRQTRQTDNTSLVQNGLSAISKSSDVLDVRGNAIYVFADLFGAAHELTLECEYYDEHGAYHPERLVLVPLYPFPFLPRIVGGLLFGGDVNTFNTGYELNREMSQYNTHFGNHITGDIYMSFGTLGVLFFAFLFGLIISKLIANRFSGIYYRSCFVIIMSLSLYMARDSVFNIIRPLSLTLLITYIAIHTKPMSIKSH